MDSPDPRNPRGNILLVDDDPSARQSLTAIMEREGYKVRCAPSGQTALMFAQEDPPDVIALDIRLPDMDGLQVCRLLKEDARTQDIRVIFISALEDGDDKVKGFAAGGVDYITKPFQVDEVLARVRTHLTLRQLQTRLELRVRERTADLTCANDQLAATNEHLLSERAKREEAQAALQARLRFEQLLADLSARFVNIAPERVDSEIETGLQQLLRVFEVDRCGLVRVSEDGTTFQITHLCQAEGIPPVPVRKELPRALFPWAYQKLSEQHEVIPISALEDMPPEASIDKQTYRDWAIKSFLHIPFVMTGSRVYVICINTVRRGRAWPEEYIPRLRLLGEMFVNALERRRMEDQLAARLRENEELKQRLERENVYLREEAKLQTGHEGFVGESQAIKAVLAQVEEVARTDSTVLILGETGTGKELLARAIHSLSARKDRTLVTVNCASLPPTLVESELFGRERGAYTGALTRMAGRFEVADGSTLFLDEVAELPLDVQAKLLRVVEDGGFERLGSTKTVYVNVRLITATNRDLAQAIQAGTFRRDLFYRLNVFPILIPPLRERPEDIPLLVWTFVREFEKKMGKRIETIPKRIMDALQHHPWPGNARELRNVIEHAMIVSKGGTLEVRLPANMAGDSPAPGNIEDVERRHILSVLGKTGWRITGPGGAAEVLGLKRTTLQSRMKKLGINRRTKNAEISSP